MQQMKLLNRATFAGLAATLVGNGIGRFAYIALMPVLIQSGWFSSEDASTLGAATLIGYIFGAPASSFLQRYYSSGTLIRTSLLLSSFSYLGCALKTAPFEWFLTLRTIAGISGAILMVLAPPMIASLHPQEMKARISGVVFSGIGLGAMLSGTIIPLLIYQSVESAWLGMGAIAFLATVLTWKTWSLEAKQSDCAMSPASFRDLSKRKRVSIRLVLLAYTFSAIGYLPHTLFWVDYIVRELGMSFASGGFYWAVFGIGAALGPIVTGILGDKVGLKKALLAAFICKATGVALPLINTGEVALFVSSLLVGMFTPGIVTLVSTYTLELVGTQLHTKSWGAMTMAFAVSQGVVGFVMAQYAPQLISYNVLFMLSTSALILSILCIAFTSTKQQGLNTAQISS
ncbi:YbfB/YjiJ family MFS transporter [Vibrio crassostreae]|uniref:YbfB/YjiJ family MFS transporter n=1 Tax=Vibrio crassostreae TaxID=246167 RepID=UPI00063A44DD|nr:YbfB/YjiJ family MFS transporter [Vibrio crassostreae]TCO04806.1 putative MFS family arabinose efflux permease [Vibrio crassostreae]CAK1926754.1 putative MFS family arabinose efflux permease [Vibrio crassostreae]CAK1990180.1 putative MFS family arabinose efflux permease [Vibrio crassostreae]CAK1992280.1 putative MFS family arabinose efflux permease [Vibrio crassostreae]CAK2012437.1 putative MFS family arabinose efflux permease [Vibrio crassostreae]